MTNPSVSDEVVISITKTEVTSETAYSTAVAVEDEEICGFEVTLNESESWVTMSTDPLSSQSSDSLSTNLDNAVFASESEGCTSERVEDMSKSLGDNRRTSIISSRVDNLLEALDKGEGNEITDEKNAVEDPILKLRVEYIEHEEENKELRTTTSNHTLDKRVNFKLDRDFFNLLEPAPGSIFCDLFARSHQTLCQVMVGAFDVSFLFNNPQRQANTSPGEASVQTPFMMFPEQRRALVSVGNDRSYTISSSGPMCEGILSQLFGCQAHLNGQNIRVNSFAYRHGLPSISGDKPVHLDSSKLDLCLNGWKRGVNGQVSQDVHSEPLESDSENKATQEGNERKFLIPDTELFSMMTKQEKPEGIAHLVADEELKAFLQITKDGDEASALFPSFSSDTMSSDCSNDGLDEELGLLDDINDELRKELAFADVVINGSSSDESRKLRKHREKKKKKVVSFDLKNNKSNPAVNQTSSDTEATLSITDSEASRDVSENNAACVHKKAVRHVRFAEQHVEFVYFAELPIADDETNDSGREKRNNKASDQWYGKFEDAYLFFEDLMEDLAFGCTNYMERNRKRPPLHKKTRLSTVYYS